MSEFDKAGPIKSQPTHLVVGQKYSGVLEFYDPMRFFGAVKLDGCSCYIHRDTMVRAGINLILPNQPIIVSLQESSSQNHKGMLDVATIKVSGKILEPSYPKDLEWHPVTVKEIQERQLFFISYNDAREEVRMPAKIVRTSGVLIELDKTYNVAIKPNPNRQGSYLAIAVRPLSL